MLELTFLFAAGFFGGVLNSVAGGGSFITFPALLVVGVPPISANATNTFASCAGYFSGAYAFRQDLYAHKKQLPKLIIISLLGGFVGAWWLLQTPEALFDKAIPWLLLLATLLFIFGGKMNRYLKHLALHYKHASLLGGVSLWLLLLGICIYGGFFNAGLGIISLSYLTLVGYRDINAMNGMKLLISASVSVTALVLFFYDGVIAWQQGTVVLLGTLVGGYMAAKVSKRLSQHHVRAFVIVASCAITVYFFIDIYSV